MNPPSCIACGHAESHAPGGKSRRKPRCKSVRTHLLVPSTHLAVHTHPEAAYNEAAVKLNDKLSAGSFHSKITYIYCIQKKQMVNCKRKIKFMDHVTLATLILVANRQTWDDHQPWDHWRDFTLIGIIFNYRLLKRAYICRDERQVQDH